MRRVDTRRQKHRSVQPEGACRRAAQGGCSAGFTLVEVTVTAAILLILLGFLFIPTLTAFSLFQQSQAKGEVQADTRFAMERMSREIQEAVTLTVATVLLDYDDRDKSGTAEPYRRVSFQLPAKRWISALSIYEIETPLRPSGTWISYYVRPALQRSSTYVAAYEPVENPLVLYRVETAALPGPVEDLSVVATSHTALTGVEDDDVERLSFDLQPSVLATGDSIDSLTIGLRIRRSEFVDQAVTGSPTAGPTAPRAQLKTVLTTPNATWWP